MEARLEDAWWTQFLQDHGPDENDPLSVIDLDMEHDAVSHGDSTCGQSVGNGISHSTDKCAIRCRADLLPPFVQLSPGKNKYVLAKLRDPETSKALWFVKSAAPDECGGAYHANVARDLVEWIHAVPGYETVDVEITGGGRIDYVPALSSSPSRAHVYGFSYRYGKGDHARAAAFISSEYSRSGTKISVTYDDSESLY